MNKQIKLFFVTVTNGFLTNLITCIRFTGQNKQYGSNEKNICRRPAIEIHTWYCSDSDCSNGLFHLSSKAGFRSW